MKPLVGQGADRVVILTEQRILTPEEADDLAYALMRAARYVRQTLQNDRTGAGS